MTHPTKAIVGMLLRDFISVSRGGVDEGLYTPADLQAALARTEVIDFHQTLDIDGIKVLTGTLMRGTSCSTQIRLRGFHRGSPSSNLHNGIWICETI